MLSRSVKISFTMLFTLSTFSCTPYLLRRSTHVSLTAQVRFTLSSGWTGLIGLSQYYWLKSIIGILGDYSFTLPYHDTVSISTSVPTSLVTSQLVIMLSGSTGVFEFELSAFVMCLTRLSYLLTFLVSLNVIV